MKKIYWLVLGISLIFIFFAAWFVAHGDIIFHTDIARDFLLMSEIAQKKVALIGPRADWKGLFHGPLWLYFNLPAFLLGGGNPIFVGWYWILNLILFSILYFYLVQRLFNKVTALLFVPLFLSAVFSYANSFYNPIGALLMMPIFYFFIVRYQKTEKLKYLLFAVFLAGLIFQFQLAVGGPILILTFCYLIYKIYQTKKYHHLLGFLIVLIPLSTFIFFDLRHGFTQTKAVINHFNGIEKYYSMGLIDRVRDRISTLTNYGLGFTKDEYSFINIIIGYLMAIAIFYITGRKKYKSEYILFLYFYLGHYLFSLFFQTSILIHYYLPLIPISILIFATFYKYLNKKIFFIFYISILFFNFLTGLKNIDYSRQFIENNKTSWKGLINVAKTTYNNVDQKEFGLYLFAPDMYGYSEKYSFLFGQSLNPNKKMIYSQKRTETFLVYEPTPVDRPDLNGNGWRTLLVKINKKPVKTINFPNGYRMEKYILTDDELKIQSDSILNDWVSQR